jgi:hypothetical protein
MLFIANQYPVQGLGFKV